MLWDFRLRTHFVCVYVCVHACVFVSVRVRVQGAAALNSTYCLSEVRSEVHSKRRISDETYSD